ncbi:protein PIGBOS1 [Megalops cyprinoides]|uniref:protein PIGBOS1 n=1 Tax=Megalops cyprinoides TaxID=118141 RepID=UPI001864C0CB|nr:protein PIGBOS1 [Megalops cyprinoides]
MFRRRIPFNQITMATLLGVAGGVYIYRPIFEPPNKSPVHPNQEDVNAQLSQEKLEVKTDLDVKGS